jgi:hypothetical protein
MIEKYSTVKFNEDQNDIAYQVTDIVEGKLILANFSRPVGISEVREVCFDGTSTEDLIRIHTNLQQTADVYRTEIRRRRYHVEKHKIKSPYFGDNFDTKPIGKNH